MLEDTRSEKPFLRRARWIISRRVACKLPVSDVPTEIEAGLADLVSLLVSLVSLLEETAAAETMSVLASWELVESPLITPTGAS